MVLAGGGGLVNNGTGGGPAAPHTSNMVLSPSPLVSLLNVPLGVYVNEDGGGPGSQVMLEATNTTRDHRGRPAARLQCSRSGVGGGVLWHDSVQVGVAVCVCVCVFVWVCVFVSGPGDWL